MNWEGFVLFLILVFIAYALRPFTWESAQREAEREWKAGDEDARVTRRWYGWVIVHRIK